MRYRSRIPDQNAADAIFDFRNDRGQTRINYARTHAMHLSYRFTVKLFNLILRIFTVNNLTPPNRLTRLDIAAESFRTFETLTPEEPTKLDLTHWEPISPTIADISLAAIRDGPIIWLADIDLPEEMKTDPPKWGQIRIGTLIRKIRFYPILDPDFDPRQSSAIFCRLADGRLSLIILFPNIP